MSKPPLLVHLVFHPKSAEARALAGALQAELSRSAELSAHAGLHALAIPTVRVPEDHDTFLPPAEDYELETTARHFIVLLADDHMAVDADRLPDGRVQWRQFAGTLFDAAGRTGGRVLPVQLSEHAWPLDPALANISFARAFGFPGKATRERFVVRRVVHELCRFLGDGRPGTDGEPPRVKVFVSHAKADLHKPPFAAKAVIDHLRADQPVAAWVDSGDIRTGSSFADAIEDGVRSNTLLCVLTDSYLSREWCRREVLAAKSSGRPVVVLNALTRNDHRSFAYLGNVPTLRWTGPESAPAAIDLLLRENLGQLHWRARLEWLQTRPGGLADYRSDHVFTSPPELVSVVGMDGFIPKPKTVLYPDPPLDPYELELLKRIHVEATTPLERGMRESRTLEEQVVGLSVSESSDIHKHGLTEAHLDEAQLELSRYLLMRGATLAYGGHLGKEGYTIALFNLVRAHNRLADTKPAARVRNYVAWPLPDSVHIRAKHQANATFVRVPRPAELAAMHPDFVETLERFKFPASKSGLHRYAWARSMTLLREKMADQTHARIVIGGKVGQAKTVNKATGQNMGGWHSSRIPGVVEEALVSLRREQPLFLIGAFGGAARAVIDVLEGVPRADLSWSHQKRAPCAPEMRLEYEKHRPAKWIEPDGTPSTESGWWGYEDMKTWIRERANDGPAAALNNGLTDVENRELFRTRDVTRMVELVLLGLGRGGRP